jgi:hypothetical protein
MKRKDIRSFHPLKAEKLLIERHYMFFETNIQDNSGALKNPVSMPRHLMGDTPFRFEEENAGKACRAGKILFDTSPLPMLPLCSPVLGR